MGKWSINGHVQYVKLPWDQGFNDELINIDTPLLTPDPYMQLRSVIPSEKLIWSLRWTSDSFVKHHEDAPVVRHSLIGWSKSEIIMDQIYIDRLLLKMAILVRWFNQLQNGDFPW